MKDNLTVQCIVTFQLQAQTGLLAVLAESSEFEENRDPSKMLRAMGVTQITGQYISHLAHESELSSRCTPDFKAKLP